MLFRNGRGASLVSSSAIAAEGDDDPEPVSHRFVCVDNGANTLICIDQRKPEDGWRVPIPSGSRDLQRIGNDRILVGHGDGAAEYASKDGKRLWQITGFTKVQTARRLSDGNTLLGIDGGPFLV